MCVCVLVAQLCLTLATPWTVACQGPLSMVFSRQEYWSGLPFPSPVPILHDFKADNIHNIINHSDSKLAFVGDNIWENLNEEEIPNVLGVIQIEASFLLVIGRKRVFFFPSK